MAKQTSNSSRYASEPKIVSRRHCRASEKELEPGSSRRIELIAERDEQRWLNRRFTSKGNVVGWYLAPESHVPFWINRKIRAKRNVFKAFVTQKEREMYKRVKASRASNCFNVTEGEMAYCIRLFEKTITPEQQEEAARKQQASAELSRILESLQQGSNQHHEGDSEETSVPEDDDAALKAYQEGQRWEEYKQNAKKRNCRLLRVMKNELRGDGIDETDLWQEAGKDQCFE